MIKDFDNWVSEQELFEMEEEMTPSLRKSLDEIGKDFTDNKEIVEAILFLGFELLNPGGMTQKLRQNTFPIPQGMLGSIPLQENLGMEVMLQ